MKTDIYIHAFAGISSVALCLYLFSDFWIPLVIGAVATLALVLVATR